MAIADGRLKREIAETVGELPGFSPQSAIGNRQSAIFFAPGLYKGPEIITMADLYPA
ncbi:MAG: hypothetical protein NT031_06160 [Planctomycetota bacterium]|nr:hypothetical protein [Planctomycetota bacterium]